MPDLKLYHPAGYFDTPAQKQAVMEELADTVAYFLNCDDFDGTPLEMRWNDIDVHLIPREDENIQFGRPFLAEITGYNYPARMLNIRERLDAIKRSFAHTLTNEQDNVAVTYIPIPNGCWA